MSDRGKILFRRSLGIVLLATLALVALVFFEYKQNIALIRNNEAILISSARETLRLYFEQDIYELPSEVDQLRENWQIAPQDYYLFAAGHQRFPFTYVGGVSSDVSDLLEIYANEKPAKPNIPFSEERHGIIHHILEARQRADKAELRNAVTTLLKHKQNYVLAPQEEIACWLTLLNDQSDKNWSRQFVESILFNDLPSTPTKISSAATIALSNANSFSSKDLDLIVESIRSIAARYAISTEAFDYFVKQLDHPFTIPEKAKDGLWLFDMEWLLSRAGGVSAVYRVDIEERLEQVEALLATQNLLDTEDRLSLKSLMGWAPLENIELTLSKASIEESETRQLHILTLKLLSIIFFSGLCITIFSQIQKNAQRKQQLVNQQEDFTRLISHELRTPVSAIRVMAETLEKRLHQGLEPKNYTSRVITETERLEGMIENIISLNQLAETQDLAKRPVQVLTIINDVVHDFQSRLGGKLVVDIRVPADLYYETNAVLFSLVLRNILSNAEKYTTQDGVSVQFEFLNKENVILIKDAGEKIEMKDWNRVFDRFYRAKRRTNTKGLGIGLHLSRAIMRSLGGNLLIAASDNRGTSWHICLKNS